MTGEHTLRTSAIADMRKQIEAVDAQLREYEMGRSSQTPEEIVRIARQGLSTVISRADGVRLVLALRSSQETKEAHETI